MTVVPVTDAGDGAANAISVVVPAAASSTPGAVTALAYTINGNSVDVTFAPPSSDGGSVVTGYFPSRNGTDFSGAGPYRAGSPLPSTARVARFANLRPGDTYLLGLEAANINGSGPLATVTVSIPTDAVVYPRRRLSHPFWTTPLHKNAPVAETSADMVSRLVAQYNARPPAADGTPTTNPSITVVPPFNTKVETDKYSMTIYEMPAGTPRVPVYSNRRKYYTDSNGVVQDLQTKLDEGVPLPDPTKIPGGTIAPEGTDGSSIFIDLGTNEEFELWRVRPAAAGSVAESKGYAWECEQGGWMRDYRFHPGWWSSSGSGITPKGGDYGVSASGFAYLGCILTGQDYLDPAITHPITMALYITGGNRNLGEKDFVLPAVRADRFNFSPTSNTVAENYRVPEGTRFRLNPIKWTDAAIDAYAAQKGQTVNDGAGCTPDVIKKILRCVRDYGIIVGDSASNVIGFSAEHQKTYGTPYNPLSVAQRPNWGDFGQVIPYADLQQVAVPTVQFHVPGGGPTSMPVPAYDFTLNPGVVGTNVIPTDISQVNVSTVGTNYGTRGSGGSLAITDGRLIYTYATATQNNILDPGVATTGVPVTVGKRYRMFVDLERLVGTSALQARISWRNSTGGLISESTGAGVSPKVGEKVQLTVDGVAPTGAVTAFVFVRQFAVAASNGDSYATDNWRLHEVLMDASPEEVPAGSSGGSTGGESTGGGSTGGGTTTPTTPTVPAWSYGDKDPAGNYLSKDIYLPDPTAGGFTRTLIGADVAQSSNGWSYASGGGSFSGVDTSDPVRGSSSLRITTNGTNTVSVAQRGGVSANLSKGRILRCLIYVDNINNLDSIGFHLASSGSSTMADSVLRTLDSRFFRQGWQTFTLNLAEVPVASGSPNLAAINYIKINVRDKGTSGSPKPVTVKVAGLWSETTAPMTKAAVAFTFDDGGVSHYTQAFPIMRDEFGMVGTAYVMPGDFAVDPSKMTGANVKAMAAAGWTIGAHAWTGATHTGMSATALADNIAKTRSWLTSNIGESHSQHFAYWDGLDYQNADVRSVLQSNFRTVRNNKGSQASLETQRPARPTDMRSWLTGSDAYGWAPGDGTNAPVYPGTRSSNSAADWLNRAINGNGLAIFTFHTVGPNGLDLGVFRSYLSHAKAAVDAGVLDVLSMEQVAARYGL